MSFNEECEHGMILHESENMTPMVANIEIKNDKQFQIVYASQLYGTFFAVGAKLIITEDDKIAGMGLALNNYKGLYNIGMLPSTKNNFIFKNRQALITLDLMVDNGKNCDKLKRGLIMHFPSAIPFDKIDVLNFTRELFSLTEVCEPEKHLDEGIFDSEFYVRNGKYIAAIERMDNYLPKPDLDKEESDDPALSGDPDTNCMNSKVKLLK